MEYKYCCKILYNYYAKTHCSVNSLTENLNDFIDVVPKTIIYTKSKDKIKYCTFIEKKAIAYLASFNDTIWYKHVGFYTFEFDRSLLCFVLYDNFAYCNNFKRYKGHILYSTY